MRESEVCYYNDQLHYYLSYPDSCQVHLEVEGQVPHEEGRDYPLSDYLRDEALVLHPNSSDDTSQNALYALKRDAHDHQIKERSGFIKDSLFVGKGV